MFFSEYLLKNFVMLFELIGLVIIQEISVHISERVKRLTLTVVLLLFVESLLFALEDWTQSFARLSPLRPALTACLYAIYPIILLFVRRITVREQTPKSRTLLLLVPELVSIPFYFTSQWTHWICWFTEDNHYQGGPLSYWPYAVFGFYSLVFLIQNIAYFRNNGRSDRLALGYVVLGPILGVLYYMVFESNSDYSALFTSAIVLYFIFVYIHMARIDPLTGLLNRQSYYQAIQTRGKTVTGLVSVDMNDLKYWNDCQGHEAGDLALKTVAGILQEGCGPNGSAYRTGGDEFMLLFFSAGESEVTGAIDRMRNRLAQTPYGCAFGYAMKRQTDQLEDAIREADRRMYEDKAACKQGRPFQGGLTEPSP